jgi:hypothetical protein
MIITAGGIIRIEMYRSVARIVLFIFSKSFLTLYIENSGNRTVMNAT